MTGRSNTATMSTIFVIEISSQRTFSSRPKTTRYVSHITAVAKSKQSTDQRQVLYARLCTSRLPTFYRFWFEFPPREEGQNPQLGEGECERIHPRRPTFLRLSYPILYYTFLQQYHLCLCTACGRCNLTYLVSATLGAIVQVLLLLLLLLQYN